MPREFESHSSVTTFTLCPRKYKHRYIDGYEPRDTSPELRRGKAWSEYQETGHIPNDAPVSSRDFKILSILAKGYSAIYADDVAWTREAPLEFDGFRGKLDGLGTADILESKLTRSRVDWLYWEKRRIDQQCMLYVHMARAAGHEIEGVVYDVTRWPMLRPRRGESEAWFLERVEETVHAQRHEYFQRRRYTWSDDELLANYDNMRAIVGSMPIEGDYFPQNRNSCQAFGKLCEYFPVCASDTTIDDPELYTIRTRV